MSSPRNDTATRWQLRSGAQVFCDVLQEEGVDCVFGLPGTQTVVLYEALRHSDIRAIVPTHELSAAFMAYGYARVSGKVSVLLTIPGPGFAFAPAGLAEAKLDGVPIVHVTLTPSRGPTGEPAFQALDQAAVARPLVKAVFRAEHAAEVRDVMRDALRTALRPETGPVFVELADAAVRGTIESPAAAVPSAAGDQGSLTADRVELEQALARVAAARKPVVFVATLYAGATPQLAQAAATCRTPVLVPAPSRGVVPEDHPWMLCCDTQFTRFEMIQSVVDQADCILVLGTRLAHIATAGFRLKLPSERVVCVSESGEPLPHGYAASLTVHARAQEFVQQLIGRASTIASSWTIEQLQEVRKAMSSAVPCEPPEPVVNGGTASAFFAAMRAALPRDTIVITDSGLHQALVRRHFPIFGEAGLVFPCELQSMGFGLPAAIGAKLACPNRTVAVVLGDGGFAISGLELLTASRDDIPVVVVVFNDGKLNLIRLQQLREYGVSHGTDLQALDFERFAEAVNVGYELASDGVTKVLEKAVSSRRPTLVEVVVGDSNGIRRLRTKRYLWGSVRRIIGPGITTWLKRKLR